MTGHETAAMLDQARRLKENGPEGLRQARQLLEQALRNDPADYQPLDLEVQVLVEMNEGRLAKRLLEEYIRYYPENTDASARLAWWHWRMGEHEEALAEIRASLARDGANTRARRWLVEWLLELGKTEEAAEEADCGLDVTPKDRELRLLRGRIAVQAHEDSAARRIFTELLGERPHDVSAVLVYTRFLLDRNDAAGALRTLEPIVATGGGGSSVRLMHAEALLKDGKPPAASRLLEEVLADPALSEGQSGEIFSTMQFNLGLGGTDDLTFRLLEEHRLPDPVALAFLDWCGQREHRGNLGRIFRIISEAPLHYPRTLSRFLARYHWAPVVPGTISRWIDSHRAEIERDSILWGGVGSWLVARKRWQDAADHLRQWRGRPGIAPWMLLLLARACEELGDLTEANRVYRSALQMQPDHTEPAIRGRLAFNLAMEGMAGAGQLLLLDCSEEGKKLATVEDLIRIYAVESIAAANRLDSLEEKVALFSQTLDRMRELARDDRYADTASIIRRFHAKTREILAMNFPEV